VLYGLRTFWKDAAGGTELHLFVNPATLAEGAAGGLAMGLAVMGWTLRGLRRLSPRALLSGTPAAVVRRVSHKRTGLIAAIASILALLLLASGAMRSIDQTAAFFGGAALLLIAALLWTSAWIGSSRHSVLALDHGHALWRLGARSTAYRPGRAIAGIALIATATFLIVGLDAFRQRVVPSSDPHSGTGGFAIVGESELPIVYDPNTTAGRDNLNLTGVPDTHFYSFRLRPGEDASCLNLYQPRNPRVLGAPDAFLRAGRFRFVEEHGNPWLLLDADPGSGPIPAIADANSITYILHKKIGDEFVLNPDSDHPVRLKLVAALEGSMLQSELIVSEQNFVRAFPQEQGYRFFLIDTKASPAVVQNALSDYGFDANNATERLAAYRQVENTYLSTFQALGAVGLLLGTVGLAAVLLRNVLERRRELALLRALGYERSDIGWIVIAENLFVAGAGLAIGAGCAMVAVLPTVLARGGRAPLAAILLLLIAVPATALLSSLFAVRAVSRASLLAALRAE
jgi:putative ABC transport system permease protein